MLNTLHNKATVVLLCYFFYVLDFYMQTILNTAEQHKQRIAMCKNMTREEFDAWLETLDYTTEWFNVFPTLQHFVDLAPWDVE
jgi:hypothetical protein